ncbi:unnamed protein product [Schistosoma curassoni]|uniref:RNA-binding protein n=1 Tax=Schistosoma curassoni TaxID=6186 RepID=A0A183KVS8_9TREM|nr:unnamed protein product [Schistosoma curassoni]
MSLEQNQFQMKPKQNVQRKKSIRAYVTSTQFCNWHFSPSELVNLRSDCNTTALKRLQSIKEVEIKNTNENVNNTLTVVGLDPDQEFKIIKHYVYLMKILFDKFTTPQLPNEVSF